MDQHEVWLVLPSANREHCARNLPRWRERGYRIAILQDQIRFDAPADRLLELESYPGWAASVNLLFRETLPASASLIVAAGDDMLPDPAHSATQLAEQFFERFADGFGVMQPSGDDFEQRGGTFCGSPWMGRAWMEQMYGGRGGLCDAYYHNWADEELYWVSRCTGKLWLRPDLTQHHDHFRRRGESAPRYWVKSAADHEQHDALTFVARANAGFPGATPAGAEDMLDRREFAAAYDGKAEARLVQMLGGESTGNASAGARLGEALDCCRDAGFERVAVYGAGQHTERCGSALRSPPVEVVAILDDDSARIGGRLWNYPVIQPDASHAARFDAVVISSDAMEDRLAARAASVFGPSMPVIRLYERRLERVPASDPGFEVATARRGA